MERNVVIASITPSVSCEVRGETDDPKPILETRPWMELRGEMTEPIREVQEIVFRIWGDHNAAVGPGRPAAVGHIVGIRPHVKVLAAFQPMDFNYIWSLALSGRLTHGHLSFTKPHFNSASILYMSFSSELEE